MKRITPRQYAVALYEAIAESSKENLQTRLQNFLTLLKSRGQWKHLSRILSIFETVYEENSGTTTAEIISARPLTADELSWAEKGLKKFATTVELTNSVDKELIGGVIVKQRDNLWDLSVAGQLARLRRRFMNN